jgi:hypothetical protein
MRHSQEQRTIARPRRFAGLEHRARKAARVAGLYLLVEREQGGTLRGEWRWVFYDLKTGKLLLNYWPLTRYWMRLGSEGRVRHWREALRLAKGHAVPPAAPGMASDGPAVARQGSGPRPRPRWSAW